MFKLSGLQICEGFIPVDMSAAANNGDWVSLKNYRRALVVFFKAVGTAGQDATLTLKQATAVAGTGSKSLTFTQYWQKEATTNLQSTGQFSKVTQAAAATLVATADKAGIYVVEISGEDLDVANGFDCIQASVADVGANAQLGAVLYLLGDPVIEQAPENLPSAIVN